MGRTENGGGDQLARGAAKVQFRPAGSKVTEKKWNDMFKDFDADKFRNSDANSTPTGDSGVRVKETVRSKR